MSYLKLVSLQNETVGYTFVMGFSVKKQKHFIHFINKKKRFESDDPEQVISIAINYIENLRKVHKDKAYTLFVK